MRVFTTAVTALAMQPLSLLAQSGSGREVNRDSTESPAVTFATASGIAGGLLSFLGGGHSRVSYSSAWCDACGVRQPATTMTYETSADRFAPAPMGGPLSGAFVVRAARLAFLADEWGERHYKRQAPNSALRSSGQMPQVEQSERFESSDVSPDANSAPSNGAGQSFPGDVRSGFQPNVTLTVSTETLAAETNEGSFDASLRSAGVGLVTFAGDPAGANQSGQSVLPEIEQAVLSSPMALAAEGQVAVNVIVNPEPSSIALMVAGLGALAVFHRRRKAARTL